MFEIDSRRKEIDNIDNQIIDLLNERLNLAVEIGQIKKQHRLNVTDVKREDDIKNKILNYHAPQLFKEEILAVYAAIIKASKAVQVIE